ncbi:MAG: hypothetical protein J1F39_05615 [Clostridiales bacterium]|nr:hypothetical protein [Clostridiales bacterium]
MDNSLYEKINSFVGKAVTYKNQRAYIERITAEYIYIQQKTQFGLSFFRLNTGENPDDNAVTRGEISFEDPALNLEFTEAYEAFVRFVSDKR